MGCTTKLVALSVNPSSLPGAVDSGQQHPTFFGSFQLHSATATYFCAQTCRCYVASLTLIDSFIAVQCPTNILPTATRCSSVGQAMIPVDLP